MEITLIASAGRGGGFYGALLYPTADVYVRTDTLSWKGLDTDRFMYILYYTRQKRYYPIEETSELIRRLRIHLASISLSFSLRLSESTAGSKLARPRFRLRPRERDRYP